MVQTTTKLQLLFVCFLVLQPEVTTMFSSKAKAMQQSERFQNCSAWWIPNTTFKINNDGCSMIRRCIKQQLSKLHSFHSWNHLYHYVNSTSQHSTTQCSNWKLASKKPRLRAQPDTLYNWRLRASFTCLKHDKPANKNVLQQPETFLQLLFVAFGDTNH